MVKRLLFLVAVLTGLSFNCLAGVINVTVVGSANPDGSAENPYSVIQDALDAAQPGDTVLIHPGTYTGAGNRDLSCGGKDIVVQSTDPNDPAVVASTVIDCEQSGRAFYLSGGETPACRISGLTMVNGWGAGDGGALYAIYSSPTVEKCVLFNNHATVHGGALAFFTSNARVSGCKIYSNTANNYGGAIFWRIGTTTIENCIVAANFSTTQGGGIELLTCPDARIVNCTIVANESANGGGLHGWNSSADMDNCILWDNIAAENPQIGLNSTSTIVVNYSDIQGGWGGTGNIDKYPLFAAYASDMNPADCDFHLHSSWGRWGSHSLSLVYDDLTSPCIDAGDPASSYNREPWPHGNRLNMGAYGGTRQASMNGNVADFNVDGKVDFNDMMQFAAQWLQMEAGIVNLDSQGTVDFYDMTIFAQNWGWTR